MPYTIPSSVISPGAVYQPRKSKLILDQITGAIAAWSTRRLISSAPADIARGRDASTNEQDFTAAELAGSGFTDLAGAGDGFYVTLYDQIGSNNATQVTAASQPKGVDTGALITDGAVPVLEFDGLNDYVPVADNPAFDISNNLTVFCKAKNNNSTLPASQVLISKYETSNAREWVFYVSPSNKLSFTASNPSNGYVGAAHASDNAITPDNFNTYAVTFSDGVVKLYSNGSELSNTITSGTVYTTLYNGTAPIGLGSTFSGGPAASFWNGYINDFVIYNRVLSASEISKLHAELA